VKTATDDGGDDDYGVDDDGADDDILTVLIPL